MKSRTHSIFILPSGARDAFLTMLIGNILTFDLLIAAKSNRAARGAFGENAWQGVIYEYTF